MGAETGCMIRWVGRKKVTSIAETESKKRGGGEK